MHRIANSILLVIFVVSCYLCISVVEAAQPSNAIEINRWQGITQDDMFKMTFPRSDLKVKVGDVVLKPALALTSWIGFKPVGSEQMAVGDLVLLPKEIEPVTAKLLAHGFEVTGLYHYLAGSSPEVLKLHFHGSGTPSQLALWIKDVLQQTRTPINQQDFSAELNQTKDWSNLETMMGQKGSPAGDVIRFSFPRAESIREKGVEIPPFLGMETVINFQKTSNKNIVTTGDFILLPNEVTPVAQALTDHGITITAIYHHTQVEPCLAYLHFWGSGSAQNLTQGLKAALQKNNNRE